VKKVLLVAIVSNRTSPEPSTPGTADSPLVPDEAQGRGNVLPRRSWSTYRRTASSTPNCPPTRPLLRLSFDCRPRGRADHEEADGTYDEVGCTTS
jgi:hypothetical protein